MQGNTSCYIKYGQMDKTIAHCSQAIQICDPDTDGPRQVPLLSANNWKRAHVYSHWTAED